MDNKKTDGYYVEQVLENIDLIIKYTNGKSYEEFNDDPLLIDAVMFRLVQMAENITHISYEFKNQHSNIPWGEIVGFRNGIVHDYGKTDYTIVYDIISKDLFVLKDELEQINYSTTK